MFKLLTEEERQKVAREYAVRRAIVTLSALILVFVVGIIGLLPSYVLSNARQHEVLERTRIMGDVGQRGDEAELQTWFVNVNRELRVLSPKFDTDRPSNFIKQIIDEKVLGIRLTGFSWTKVKDKITLSVGGVARDRQTLITFEDSINASGNFAEVTLPISNLAQDKDIDFQIKLGIASSSPQAQTP